MTGKPTPGPWQWMGSDLGGLYLATTHSGRIYVMGFKRRGMNGAEPMFQVGGRMVPASELVAFDVGDGTARGFVEGKADPSVYRYDVAFIDHPNARLIAAAPSLLDALIRCEAWLVVLRTDRNEAGRRGISRVIQDARAAIAAAKGEIKP